MKAKKRSRDVSRMAVNKPTEKPASSKAKATSSPARTKPTDEARRHTSSTSSAEPAAIPTGRDNNGRGKNPERVRLTYGPGAESKTYDLTPDWDVHDIVEVLWIDAIANAITEWMDLEDLEDCQPCETLSVGYLLKDHPEWITIVGLLNEGSAGHAITIPRGMVLAVRVLNRP